MLFNLFSSFLNARGNFLRLALSSEVVPQSIHNCGRVFKRPYAYLHLHPSCRMSWHCFCCRARPKGALLACAGRGLFCFD